MNFRRPKSVPPTPGEARRQSRVIQFAWRHFGEPGPVIAFLNTRQDALGGSPIQLAIESDDGLQRVERLLKDLTDAGTPNSSRDEAT